MRAPALGEAVSHLPWLSPDTASLVALARASAVRAWEEVRDDPGAVLLLVRYGTATRALPRLSCFANLVREPAIIEAALQHLDAEHAGFVDWASPSAHAIHENCLAIASAAQALAERSGASDPDNAWAAGLLAPLGWLAICAVGPDEAAACMSDPRAGRRATPVQQERWGLDHAQIARRLTRRWGLPGWIAAVSGHLGLPVETAQLLGADQSIFRLVQLAVALVQRRGPSLFLELGETAAANAQALDLSGRDLEEVERGLTSPPNDAAHRTAWHAPGDMPLLRDLLLLALENKRSANAPLVRQLEDDVDSLHETLQTQQANREQVLRDLKLRAMAEFAAGAGHEINNPLAVISGQAQYLAGHEPEPARQRALQTITSQARRIHETLTALMQFARPPQPRKQPADLTVLTLEAMKPLEELATERRVQLVGPSKDSSLSLVVDPGQIRTALGCLIRNAIEAAPVDGWVKVHFRSPAPEIVQVIVEDNGAGLPPALREHLFDPFYSGRQAGRSRGLGLPTAWRLAREHGGDVRAEEHSPDATRFVLTLPRNLVEESGETNGHAPPRSILPGPGSLDVDQRVG